MTRIAPVLIAAAFAVLLSTPLAAAAREAGPQPTDLTAQFASAGLAIRGFQAFEIGGVVVLRGRAVDHATAEQAGIVAQSLGFTRVANLVQVASPVDDATIMRRAERELAIHRSLDGCTFHVKSEAGVLTVTGEVHHELQKDTVVQLLRNIDGVKAVRASLDRR